MSEQMKHVQTVTVYGGPAHHREPRYTYTLKDRADGCRGHYCVARQLPGDVTWEYLTDKGEWCGGGAMVLLAPDAGPRALATSSPTSVGVALPSGEVAKVGDIIKSLHYLFRVVSVDPLATDWWSNRIDSHGWKSTSWGRDSFESPLNAARLATAAEIAATTIPLADIPEPLRAEVERLRKAGEKPVNGEAWREGVREAGGKAWDKIDDPEAYIAEGRGDASPPAPAEQGPVGIEKMLAEYVDELDRLARDAQSDVVHYQNTQDVGREKFAALKSSILWTLARASRDTLVSPAR